MQVPRSLSPLPHGLTMLDDRPRGALHCTTPELASLNARLGDAARDCLLLSVQVLEAQLQVVVQYAGLLARVVDAVALVDVLVALAAVAKDTPKPWTQPSVQTTGAERDTPLQESPMTPVQPLARRADHHCWETPPVGSSRVCLHPKRRLLDAWHPIAGAHRPQHGR